MAVGWRQRCQRLAPASDHQIAAQQEARAAGCDPHGLDLGRAGGDPQVAQDGAALLGKAGHVEHGRALAFQMGGHAQDRPDRDHAGAADTRHHDAVGPIQRRQRRLGQALDRRDRRGCRRPRPARRHALDRDEARAEALQAGIVLVAARLVDLALAAERRFERQDRDTVRDLAAIAAALADLRVDHHPRRRIVHQPALAPAPLLGGAGLIVDQHRGARHLAQLALDLVQLVAMADRDAGREAGIERIFVRLIGHDHDLDGPFSRDLAADLGHGQRAVHGLAAGHGDRIVVEDLEGDVDAGGDRGADRHDAGMVVGAIADVLEDMVALGERRLADPARPLAAHLGVDRVVAIHPLRHVVAADAGPRDAARRHPGRGVVRAAGAEIGRAQGGCGHPLGALRLRLEGGQPSGQLVVGRQAQEPLGQGDRDLVAR